MAKDLSLGDVPVTVQQVVEMQTMLNIILIQLAQK